MMFPVKITSKGETGDVHCRRGGKFDVIKEEGIVVWKVVLS